VSESITVRSQVHFANEHKGRKSLKEGPAPAKLPPGRVPRVARLLALAHRFDGLIREGVVKDYAELARLGHVSRARISQIMNLLLLAPDVQEALLFLPSTQRGRDPIRINHLQPIALTPDWSEQRRRWRGLTAPMNLDANR
jgi:hypothetical protein